MPDWVKRVNKERSTDLAAGERVVAACYFQGRGSAVGQMTYGAIRGLGGELASQAVADQVAARARADEMGQARAGDNALEGSAAARIPNDKGVIAATDRRLIVFGYKQGVFKTKIEDVAASIGWTELAGWSYKSGKVASVLNLAFSDGSDVGIELPRANRPEAFADALNIPRI